MTNTSPARIREELYWADKMVDRRGDRHQAIERSNRIREKFNHYAYGEGHAERVFAISRSTAGGYRLRSATVDVLAFDDGMYCYRVETSYCIGGMGSGFSPLAVCESREKAIRTGVGQVLAWALQTMPRQGIGVIRERQELQMIASKAKEFLNQRQAALF
jgi:hypothetical protein